MQIHLVANLYKETCFKGGIKTFILKKDNSSQQLAKRLIFCSFNSIIKKVSLFTLFQWLSIVCGPQSLWTLLFYYLHELLKLFITVTCFTLCSIKSWCTAAVESVHSVCTGPVVLTGTTCTFIDLCFRRWDWKDLKCNCLCC